MVTPGVPVLYLHAEKCKNNNNNKKTGCWPESGTTAWCPMHGLNGLYWEDNVIKIEDILSNDIMPECFTFYWQSYLISCAKMCICPSLSKLGATCLCIWPSGALRSYPLNFVLHLSQLDEKYVCVSLASTLSYPVDWTDSWCISTWNHQHHACRPGVWKSSLCIILLLH